MTDLVPSEIACLESSPGRIRRTAVWISREEMVDFLEYEARREASSAMRSKTVGDSKSEIIREGIRNQRTVVDERVEDGHRLVGDTSVGVDLLQDCMSLA